MGDPECAWVLHGVECVPISANIYRREYLTQDKEKCNTQVIEKPTTTPQPLLQRKMECLCESPTQVPCTTEVFQREVVTSTAEFLTCKPAICLNIQLLPITTHTDFSEPLGLVSVLHRTRLRSVAEPHINKDKSSLAMCYEYYVSTR
ncbi:hypothetical protein TELCIR_14524 [Teladorsagia circumcincta]|uniref:Uncharacterized protein n=1 Tax=Teladorsagia circumcincta TaxID=45464 RepID=A0A2G9U0X6_TELCI|nr:hypothetical protein TELCIR_14524 [Teladorsagia circumcincta]